MLKYKKTLILVVGALACIALKYLEADTSIIIGVASATGLGALIKKVVEIIKEVGNG